MKLPSLQPAICAVLAVAFTHSLHAVAPTWWAERGVIAVGAPADDYHLVNQGQLKNFALGAWVEMQAKLPGGAGAALTALVSGWTVPGAQTDDFATANRGQLKNLAKVFYDRLDQAKYHGTPLVGWQMYPWTDTDPADDDDYAYANIGQVKNVFSFDLRPDTDGDGMPDWWEDPRSNSLDMNDPADATGDPDGDGLLNLQ